MNSNLNCNLIKNKFKSMSYQRESFGMMDEGYFVPRSEIIDWINNLLDVLSLLI